MMDISRLKYRVEVLGDNGDIKRYGPFNEQKAREFFEVEESFRDCPIVRLEEEGIQRGGRFSPSVGLGPLERGHREKKKVEVPLQ